MSSAGNSWGRECSGRERQQKDFLPCIQLLKAGAHFCTPKMEKAAAKNVTPWADLQGGKFYLTGRICLPESHMLAFLFPKEPTILRGKNSVLLAFREEGNWKY